MEMTLARKTDLSLYYYIKDRVLSDFIEKEEDIALSYVSELSCQFESEVYVALSAMLPSPTDRGRGWVYFDCVSDPDDHSHCLSSYTTVSGYRVDGVFTTVGTPEQSNRVIVYDSLGTIISGSEYMVDYLDGRIVTSGTVTPASVDYYFNYVSVVDEWAAIEAADPPVVVIDLSGMDVVGYQLGGGRKIIRKVEIHIFASDPAERNDIVETIFDGLYLKSAPIYNFPLGSVLDYDGTFFGRKENADKLNTLFDRTTESGISGNMLFENVSSRHVNLPLLMTRNVDDVMLSDLNAYRSKISFDLITYT